MSIADKLKNKQSQNQHAAAAHAEAVATAAGDVPLQAFPLPPGHTFAIVGRPLPGAVAPKLRQRNFYVWPQIENILDLDGVKTPQTTVANVAMFIGIEAMRQACRANGGMSLTLQEALALTPGGLSLLDELLAQGFVVRK